MYRAVRRFSRLIKKNHEFVPEPPYLSDKIEIFLLYIRIIQMTLYLRAIMSYDGFCLKCKTYGPIKDGKLIVMSNGRTRCAGLCSEEGCTGKISKIVS